MSGIIAQNTLDNSGLIKAPAGGGAWTFIKKLTASGSSSLTFADGTSDVILDSTYKEYVFYFVNIHPATQATELQFQVNASAGSGFNETMTTNLIQTYNYEDSSYTSLNYRNSHDQGQGTAYQSISDDITDDADGSCSGYLHLFEPSSSVFVKHFISRVHTLGHDTTKFADTKFCAGYINTTTAIDEIDFKMSSGNIDAGSIFLHGLTI